MHDPATDAAAESDPQATSLRHRFQSGQKQVLEKMARNAEQSTVLESLVRMMEGLVEGMRASVLRMDADGVSLRLFVAPNLPAEYNNAIDGIQIGRRGGSCGTAAWMKQRVIAEDTSTDPNWADYRELALTYGHRACWSHPILDATGDVLGTFAFYFTEPRRPTELEIEFIETAADLAGVVMQNARTQEALRESESRFRELAELISSAFWVFDELLGRMLYVSPAWQKVFGVTAESALAQPDIFLSAVHPDDRSKVQFKIQQQAAGTSTEIEYRIRRLDGSIRWIRDRAFPVLDTTTGRVIRTVGVADDITELKDVADQLLQKRDQLARIIQVSTVGEMAATMAHQLTQPILSINTLAYVSGEMLRSPAPLNREKLIEQLGKIAAQSQRATEIVKRVRGLAAQAEPQRQLADLNTILRASLSLLERELTQHGIRLNACETPLPLISVDAIQLEQVLVHLIRNATELLQQVPRELRVIQVETNASEARVEIVITDTGPGLSEKVIASFFEPYFTTGSDGAGLDLCISKSIVEAHGGQLTAENTQSVGTCFRISLPVAT